MPPNPYLRHLGLSAQDRVVIIHADDIGMYQAGLPAIADLMEFGLVSSAAAMVPCPWFPAAAAYGRANPQVDLGVHLTLTSEWDSCRWRPLTAQQPASGLLDSEGYFHRLVVGLAATATVTAVRQELQAQIDYFVAAGLEPTHVDAHMIAAAHPRFVTTYLEVARQNALPPFFLRRDEAGWQREGFDAETAVHLSALSRQAEAEGVPLMDNWYVMALDRPEDRVEQAKQALAALPAGLTYFLLHPALDTPELRGMARDWPNRVADYEAFMSEELAAHVQNAGIQVIGWRPLRDIMRSQR
jgi:chitin disaccharide deacetylase